MATFLKCSPQLVIDHYFYSIQEAERYRIIEEKAAIRIQTCFRRYIHQKSYNIKHFAATQIQRVYRGYKYGKKVRNQLLVERAERQEGLLFDYYASQIQKMFRGYWSRKYVHNFAVRKQYLNSVARKGEEVLEYVEKWRRKQQALRQEEKEIKEFEQFERVTENLHHLVSTKTIPGVYKRLDQVYSEPTIYDIPIEDHLREASRTRYIQTLTQPRPKSSSIRPNSAVRLPPLNRSLNRKHH